MKRTVLLVCALSFILLPIASAQSIFATLSGSVRDASGAVVPGADVVIKNVSSQTVYKSVTNREGFFTQTTLLAGTYDVTATMKGFRTWVGRGIVVNSSDSKSINIELALATTTEKVEVTIAAEDVAVVDSGEKST